MEKLEIKIELQSAYDVDDYETILYRLLAERPKEINISHKKMPTWREHKSFLASRPYKAWFIIINDEHIPVGAIYLTHKNEIGTFIFNEFKRKGYATAAIKKLIAVCSKQEYFANINPKNEASIKLFEKFGFKHIQNTYKREP